MSKAKLKKPEARSWKPEVNGVVRLTSGAKAAEFNELCRRPEVVHVNLSGTIYEFSVHRLTPADAAVIKGVLQGALPPQKLVERELADGKKVSEPVFDFADAEYRAKHRETRLLARSLTIWHGCPVVKEMFEQRRNEATKGAAGGTEGTSNIEHRTSNIEPPGQKEIHDFILTLWTDEVLEALWLRIAPLDEAELAQLENFT